MRTPIPFLALALASFCAAASLAAEPAAPAAAVPAKSPLETALEQLSSPDAAQRRLGIHALGGLGDRAQLPKIISALDDADAFVRSSAIDVIGRLRATEGAAKVADLLVGDPEAQVRQQAAVSLSYAWTPEAAKPLIKALDDKEAGVRYAAARTIGAARVQEAVSSLNKIVTDDPDGGMRRAAAGALQLLRDPSSREPFLKALKDSDDFVRREAAKALAFYGGDETVAALREVLKDKDPFVPIQAIESLARLGETGPDDEAVLLERLGSDDLRVRSLAANALGRVASKDSLKALKKAAETEKHPAVKRSLQFAIDRITAMEKRKK